MPIHSKPPVTSVDSLFAKTGAARGKVKIICHSIQNVNVNIIQAILHTVHVLHFIFNILIKVNTEQLPPQYFHQTYSATSTLHFGEAFAEPQRLMLRTFAPC